MKKLLNVVAGVLALNFIALAFGVGWLYRAGRLGPERVKAIKEVLFPPEMAAVPATQPAMAATTQPSVKLDELLAQYAGKPPAEQLRYIRESFDSQMAKLEHEERVLHDLQTRVTQEREALTNARLALEDEKKKLAQREQQATRAAADKGFQDSLALYEGLPPKQVKSIFMGLDDKTVISYLEAMDPSKSAKIIKEFKAADEVERSRKIIEKMRQPLTGGKE
jgi:hypothetical protein